MNPLAGDEDPHQTFCDREQATATTATRLFRNEPMFHALRDLVLPRFLGHADENKRTGRFSPLCIWSAGCSSGAETYSLAMVALDGIERSGRRASAQVYGTDINPDRIREGRAGTYLKPNEALVHERYRVLLHRYTETEGARIRMGARLRAVVRFGLFDMRKRARNHRFEYIVCNHVMQYYDAANQALILENLIAALQPGGVLYLEGVTDPTIRAVGLRPVPGCRHVFEPA